MLKQQLQSCGNLVLALILERANFQQIGFPSLYYRLLYFSSCSIVPIIIDLIIGFIRLSSFRMTEVMISTTIPSGGGGEASPHGSEPNDTNISNSVVEGPGLNEAKGSNVDDDVIANNNDVTPHSNTKPSVMESEPTPPSEPSLPDKGVKETANISPCAGDTIENGNSAIVVDNKTTEMDQGAAGTENTEAAGLHCNGYKRPLEEIIDLVANEEDNGTVGVKRIRTSSISKEQDEDVKSLGPESSAERKQPMAEEIIVCNGAASREERQMSVGHDNLPGKVGLPNEIASEDIFLDQEELNLGPHDKDKDILEDYERDLLEEEPKDLQAAPLSEKSEPMADEMGEKVLEERKERENILPTKLEHPLDAVEENSLNGENKDESESLDNGLLEFPKQRKIEINTELIEKPSVTATLPECEGPPAETPEMASSPETVENLVKQVQMQLHEIFETPDLPVKASEKVREFNVAPTVDPPTSEINEILAEATCDDKSIDQNPATVTEESAVISDGMTIDPQQNELDAVNSAVPVPQLIAPVEKSASECEELDKSGEPDQSSKLNDTLNSTEGALQIDLSVESSSDENCYIGEKKLQSANSVEEHSTTTTKCEPTLCKPVAVIDKPVTVFDKEASSETRDHSIPIPSAAEELPAQVVKSTTSNGSSGAEKCAESRMEEIPIEMETICLSSPNNHRVDADKSDQPGGISQDEEMKGVTEGPVGSIETPLNEPSVQNTHAAGTENTVEPQNVDAQDESLKESSSIPEPGVEPQQTHTNISEPFTLNLDEMNDVEMLESDDIQLLCDEPVNVVKNDLTKLAAAKSPALDDSARKLNREMIAAALFDFRTSFKDVTRENLEEMVLEKMIEAVLFKSQAAKNAQQIATNFQKMNSMKDKLEEMRKQCRTLEFMYTSAVEQVRTHEKKGCKIQPRPVCRTVGIQSQSIHFVKCRTCGTKTTTGTFKSGEFGKRPNPLTVPTAAEAFGICDPPPAKKPANKANSSTALIMPTRLNSLLLKSASTTATNASKPGPLGISVQHTAAPQPSKKAPTQQTQPPPLVSRSASLPGQSKVVPHQVVLLGANPTQTPNSLQVTMVAPQAPKPSTAVPRGAEVVDLTEDDDPQPPSKPVDPIAVPTTVIATIQHAQSPLQYNGYPVQRSVSLGANVPPPLALAQKKPPMTANAPALPNKGLTVTKGGGG